MSPPPSFLRGAPVLTDYGPAHEGEQYATPCSGTVEVRTRRRRAIAHYLCCVRGSFTVAHWRPLVMRATLAPELAVPDNASVRLPSGSARRLGHEKPFQSKASRVERPGLLNEDGAEFRPKTVTIRPRYRRVR